MARYTEASCRLCRREGEKLFLKGQRCYTGKCAIARRSFAPGQHGQGRKKISEYGTQLREKQKTKRFYGVLESQFRKTFESAEQHEGQNRRKPAAAARTAHGQCRLSHGPGQPRAQKPASWSPMVTSLLNGKKADIPSMQPQSRRYHSPSARSSRKSPKFQDTRQPPDAGMADLQPLKP